MNLRPHNVRPFRRTLRPPIDGTPADYRIYRSIDGTNFVEIAELEDPEEQPGGFFWDDTGLEHGTKYWYRVRPFTLAAGNGHTTDKSWSVTVLPAPEQLQAEHVWAQGVALAWSDAAIGEEGYTLERSLTVDFADAATFTLPAGSQSFVDVGLQPQTHYWYRVRAEKGAAPSAWVPLSVQTLPLSSTLAAPGALQVTAATTTSLALAWNDQAVGETHYVLLRSDRSDFASGSVERFILGADAESFLDTGLVAGTGYWYRLFAASGTEASPIVELEAATVLPAPTSLAFQGQSFVDGVSFTWADLADNEDYYLVEWSADGS
jgi:titin